MWYMQCTTWIQLDSCKLCGKCNKTSEQCQKQINTNITNICWDSYNLTMQCDRCIVLANLISPIWRSYFFYPNDKYNCQLYSVAYSATYQFAHSFELANINWTVNPNMKYILYVYEKGQLPGLEVWGALGVKLQALQLRARFPGQTFRHNRIAQVVE